MQKLQGTYLIVVPRNSLFLIPQEAIRTAILSAHPDISAVSLSADGLNSLTLTTTGRQSALWWCGTAPVDLGTASCWQTDAEGLVFAPADGHGLEHRAPAAVRAAHRARGRLAPLFAYRRCGRHSGRVTFREGRAFDGSRCHFVRHSRR